MEGPSGLEILARLLPTLLLLLGALYAVRWYAQRNTRGSGAQPVRVVSRTGLSKGALLAIVEVGGRRLLVGVTEHGINLLSELEPEELDSTVYSTPVPTGELAVTDLAPRRTASTTSRPGMGLVDRLRDMTVRTSSSGPIRGWRP